MRRGREFPATHDLTSLRVLGSVGEPINPEAWLWYREVIGGIAAPVVDTWWMTETGRSDHAAAGHHRAQAWLGHLPVPSIKADVLDEEGNSVPLGGAAISSCSAPGRRCRARIWVTPNVSRRSTGADFPGSYFAGDGAKRDDEGYHWLLGRVDDVLNVAGHRIGTMEVESALVATRRWPRRP